MSDNTTKCQCNCSDNIECLVSNAISDITREIESISSCDEDTVRELVSLDIANLEKNVQARFTEMNSQQTQLEERFAELIDAVKELTEAVRVLPSLGGKYYQTSIADFESNARKRKRV